MAVQYQSSAGGSTLRGRSGLLRDFFTQNQLSLYDYDMLLRFRCKNFRSIREAQEISLVAARTRSDENAESLINTPFDDLKLLRCAGVYGANASGKSNALYALSSFRHIVANSQRLWKPNGPIPAHDPFLLDEFSQTEPTEFEIRFLIDSNIYKYGFLFDQTTFRAEWLIDSTNRDKVLFRRTTENGNTKVEFPNRNLGKTSEDARHLDGIRLDVRPNSLFLSSSAQRNHLALAKIYTYISENLESIRGQNVPHFLLRSAATCSETDRHQQMKTMLKFADIGVSDIEISKKDMPDTERKPLLALITALKEANPEDFSQWETGGLTFPPNFEIRMAHQGAKGKAYMLDSSRESDGTLAFFSILGPLLDKLRDGKVLLIDELESSLHPTLARQLVRIFNSPGLNPKGAQIVFTTHDTNLLDLNLLRRDQIWFTEKDGEGATSLYPLSDFRPRKDQDIESGYLGGRFGALPVLDDQLLNESLT